MQSTNAVIDYVVYKHSHWLFSLQTVNDYVVYKHSHWL
jgi:hypothetical protein